MEVFDESRIPLLTDPRVTQIHQDPHSNVWVATDGGRVLCLGPDRQFALDLCTTPGADRAVAMRSDRFGRTWIYSAAGQLLRIAGTNADVWMVGGQYPSVFRGLTIEDGTILWVCTDWGMYGFDLTSTPTGQEPAQFRYAIPASKLDFAVESRAGGYWRIADGRIQKWITNQLVRDFGPYPWKPAARVSTAIEDHHGCLIVGTINQNDGLYWMRPDGSWVRISSTEGLSHDGILALWYEKDGTLWVGTDGGGLNRIRPRIFTVVPESRGWVVQSVCPDPDGGLWLGFNGSGAIWWRNDRLIEYGPEQGLLNPNVRAVMATRTGTWIGTAQGLFRLQRGRVQLVGLPGTIAPAVSAILHDGADTLWVGTHTGLYAYTNGTWIWFNHTNGLPQDYITCLALDRSGVLWIGTSRNGLVRFELGRVTGIWSRTNGLPANAINALLFDGQVLWVGSAAGPGAIVDGRAYRLPDTAGFPVKTINYIILDGFDHLWFGSNLGLVRASRKELLECLTGVRASVAARHFTRADGLPTSECTAGSQPAAACTPDGTLWFPTIKGLVKLEPHRLTPNTNPPTVVIQSVKIDGNEIVPDTLLPQPPAKITVPPGKRRIGIAFTAPSFTKPERTRFRYKLEGFEPAWTEVIGQTAVQYTRLPPGHYTFCVTACNEDGFWNPFVASIPLEVMPPFWRRGWFIAVSTAAGISCIVGLGYLVSAIRFRRRLYQLERQRALERERSRIARDLHDQLGANLAQIALLAELTESAKDDPAEVRTHVTQIMETARRTTEALDEIVWATNPAHDSLESLVSYICKHFQEYLAGVGIRPRLELPDAIPMIPVPPDVRHNIYLACREAVTNIVKHSRATEATLKFEIQTSTARFEIRDNGCGFVASELGIGHDGLINIRRRLGEAGGRATIHSNPGCGTLVVLEFPLHTEPRHKQYSQRRIATPEH